VDREELRAEGTVDGAPSHAGVVDYSGLDYRRYWDGEHMRLFDEQEKAIVSGWLPSTRGWFFDLGCGFGRMVPLYAGRPERTLAIDYATNNLHMTREAYPDEELTLVAADACRLPFRDSSLDGGICVRLLQNVPKAEDMMRELARVLRPGAHVVLSYFNRRNLLRFLRYGTRCLRRTHRLEHIATYGAMYGTHPAYFRFLRRSVGLVAVIRKGAGLVYQISGPVKSMQRLIARSRGVRAVLGACCRTADAVLGRLNLSLWQFVLLQKPLAGSAGAEWPARPDFADILACTRCGATPLRLQPERITCPACGQSFPRTSGVADLRAELSAALAERSVTP
jgi:ubiquinone/menaquinone biosynthesis C-methylase UbiE